jgi:hypothetical protein
MEPEAVATGPFLGGLALGEETSEAAGPDGPECRLLSPTDAADELPGGPAQFQGKVKNQDCREDRMQFVSRRQGKPAHLYLF